MAILTTNQILDYIKNFIKSKYPNVDTTPGSDLYDLLFHSQAQVARRIFEEIERIQNNQSVLTTIGVDLDLIAKNFNTSRRVATYATGEVTFYTRSFSSDITIPIESIISTAGTNVTPPIRFKTLQTKGMNVANKPIYFDSTAAWYGINVLVQAEISGSAGNIDTNSISQLVTSITGIDGVVNKTPTTGGLDAETDANLQQRCLDAYTVTTGGTLDGYRRLLQQNFAEVLDVYALGPFDQTAIRTTGVDLFTLTSDVTAIANQVQAQETFTYVTGNTEYVPVNRPIISIDSVKGFDSSSVARTFIPYSAIDADYRFTPDILGERGLSVNSSDRIVWMPLGIKPLSGSTVTITYTYDSKIGQLQNFIDLDENKIVGADALIKKGLRALITLNLTITTFPNVNIVNTKTKISAAISQYLSEFKFGDHVDISDLVIVAQTGKWTDYIITEVDFVKFNEASCYAYISETVTTKTVINGIITLAHNEYARLNSLTIS